VRAKAIAKAELLPKRNPTCPPTSDFTHTGHVCREAIQLLITDLVRVPDTPADR
jgi:hypothetical protein